MNVEDWLREQSQTVPPVSGPPDGKERVLARVRANTPARRALRVALASVEIGVVVLAVGAVVTVLSRGDGTPAASVGTDATMVASAEAVAWIDTPGAPFQSGPSKAVKCGASDLNIEVGRVGAYHGMSTQLITLTNTTEAACQLPGPPPMTAEARSKSEAVDPAQFAQYGVVIGAGSDASILLGAPASCAADPAKTADTLKISIDRGAPTTLHGIYLPLACGDPRVALFESEAVEPDNEPRGDLVASWVGPDSAEPGSTVSYVVRLANPTARDIALDPCPSYTQHANGDEVSQTLLLNCAEAPSIPAGGSIDFAMELTLAPDTGDSVIKVGWHLEVAGGTTTGSDIVLK
jgi:hypothetical protein